MKDQPCGYGDGDPGRGCCLWKGPEVGAGRWLCAQGSGCPSIAGGGQIGAFSDWLVPMRPKTHRKDDNVLLRNRGPDITSVHSSVGVCNSPTQNFEVGGLKRKRGFGERSFRV